MCTQSIPQHPCMSSSCSNGTCIVNFKAPGAFYCDCMDGWGLDAGGSCTVQKGPCDPNPCRHDGSCTERQDGGFECACPDGKEGNRCERIVVRGVCASQPCGDKGLCLEDSTSSRGLTCMCDPGYESVGDAECRAAESTASCSDGIMNGEESDVDCGSVSAGGDSCALCGAGSRCISAENCGAGLICREQWSTCGPAEQPVGMYVGASGLQLLGVSVSQFRAVLEEPFKERIMERLACDEVIIERVRQPSQGGGRRVMSLAGPFRVQRSLQGMDSSSLGVEVDFSMRFAAAKDEFEAQLASAAYLRSEPQQGGNGLLEDLQAAAPVLATRMHVAADSVEVASELVVEARVVASVPSSAQPSPSAAAESPSDDDSKGGISAFAIVGIAAAILVMAGVGGALYFYYCRQPAQQAERDAAIKVADEQAVARPAAPARAELDLSNPVFSDR